MSVSAPNPAPFGAFQAFWPAKTLMPGGFTPPAQFKGMGSPQGLPCGAAAMQVFSQNDGPVTILFDTDHM